MNITKQKLKEIEDLIILIKVEPQHEYIYDLMDKLGLDQMKVDAKVDKVIDTMNITLDNNQRKALRFVNEMINIWEDK
tara:strand:+ start:1220 stop:1453 length:234 start_codon:yes stop_codon:yes gene_type:complete